MIKCAQRPCPLCGFHGIEPLADLEFGDFDGTSLYRRVTVVECTSCGQVYNDNSITPVSLEEYYRNETLYAAEMGVGSGGMSPWDMKRYASTLKAVAPFVPSKDSLIVDVGCAKGGFLSFLKGERYKNIRGVDINSNCVRFVRDTFGISAELGTVHDLPLGDREASVLVYSHVLEHVCDLFQALAEARRTLADDGILFVELPDACRYGTYPVSTHYWFSQREHINHFDILHLESLLRRAGFEPIAEGSMLMPIATHVFTPLIYVVARKAPLPIVGSTVLHHCDLRETLRRYVADETERIAPLRRQVETVADSGRPTYVWGIGLEFFSLYIQAGLNQCKHLCLVDKNLQKQMRTVDGVPIRPPECLLEAPSDSVVVITSALHKTVMQEHLRKIRFGGEVVVLT